MFVLKSLKMLLLSIKFHVFKCNVFADWWESGFAVWMWHIQIVVVTEPHFNLLTDFPSFRHEHLLYLLHCECEDVQNDDPFLRRWKHLHFHQHHVWWVISMSGRGPPIHFSFSAVCMWNIQSAMIFIYQCPINSWPSILIFILFIYLWI